MRTYSPQPVDELRRRYPKALEKVYDIEKVKRQPQDTWPGNNPQNIFDFPDKVRVIASMEKYDDGVLLHVSASFAGSEAEMAELFPHPPVTREEMLAPFVAAFAEISDEKLDSPPFWFEGFTDVKMVPHWYKRIDTDDAKKENKAKRKA